MKFILISLYFYYVMGSGPIIQMNNLDAWNLDDITDLIEERYNDHFDICSKTCFQKGEICTSKYNKNLSTVHSYFPDSYKADIASQLEAIPDPEDRANASLILNQFRLEYETVGRSFNLRKYHLAKITSGYCSECCLAENKCQAKLILL